MYTTVFCPTPMRDDQFLDLIPPIPTLPAAIRHFNICGQPPPAVGFPPSAGEPTHYLFKKMKPCTCTCHESSGVVQGIFRSGAGDQNRFVPDSDGQLIENRCWRSGPSSPAYQLHLSRDNHLAHHDNNTLLKNGMDSWEKTINTVDSTLGNDRISVHAPKRCRHTVDND